ncbi:DUF554 domain-containing protein [Treponema sp.]|uniref:DUF554 domain-containing protein n=1 Tax=Treponema sp. TaxID=166 RepID=UPI003F07CC2C
MIAVFVNCATVIFGSLIGIFFAKKISKNLSEIIQNAAGVVTCIIGIQSAFQYKSIVVLTLSLITGGLLGAWWDWDGKILSLGKVIENLLNKNSKKNGGKLKEPACSEWNFAYAFLNSSVLFCVGAMAILGSFKAGLEKDYTIIFTKSILDGFMAITFAAAMGPGTIFSCLSILVYQGALTLLAAAIQSFIDEAMLAEITAVGGALITMIGINLLGLKKIKTANYLPAVLVSVLFSALGNFIPL